jgi:hypothetical protein
VATGVDAVTEIALVEAVLLEATLVEATFVEAGLAAAVPVLFAEPGSILSTCGAVVVLESKMVSSANSAAEGCRPEKAMAAMPATSAA